MRREPDCGTELAEEPSSFLISSSWEAGGTVKSAYQKFPALSLARRALQTGHGAPTVLNAANEVAVAAFLARRLAFLDIVRVVEATLDRILAGSCAAPQTLEEVDLLDQEARAVAEGLARKSAL